MEQQVEEKFSTKKKKSTINGLIKILIIAALTLIVTGIFAGSKKSSDKKDEIQDQYSRAFRIMY